MCCSAHFLCHAFLHLGCIAFIIINQSYAGNWSLNKVINQSSDVGKYVTRVANLFGILDYHKPGHQTYVNTYMHSYIMGRLGLLTFKNRFCLCLI